MVRNSLSARLLSAALTFTLALGGVLFAPQASASAASVSELKAQLNAVESKYKKAGAAVDAALDKLEHTDDRIADTKVRQAKAAKALQAAQRVLGDRAGHIYRGGSVSPMAMLVGATSFEDFITRFDYLQRIGRQDAKAVSDVKAKRAALAKQRAALKAERDRRASDVASLKSQRAELEKDLQSTAADYERARKALAAERARQAARNAGPSPSSNGGVVVSKGANGMVFPVAGPCYYSDTFGAPRSGGRTHQGTDIMASTGVPVVAVTDGYVNAKSNGLGGKTIWLSGNGWSFYYAHLNGYARTGGYVKAGTVIGYVGSTGNASGGAPHLHFEMHPGGGGAVNPYPYLRGMQ